MADGVRINKYLSQCGVCSRREADRMLDSGRVTIDGRTAQKGMLIKDGQKVCVDGREAAGPAKEIVIAFHKPAGVVCTTDTRDRDNIVDYIHFPERIYPVGRLDKDSTGLILLTNNGQLMDEILRGSHNHEKEYVVTTDRPISPEIFRAMEEGVPILDTMTKPCRITNRHGREFHIVLTQGLNRQIRRMCEYFAYRVRKLKRIRIMNIQLGDLPEGKWRYLTQGEMEDLNRQIESRRNER